MKHFISYLDFSSEKLLEIINKADFYESSFKSGNVPQVLKNKNVLIWSYGNGFRNHLAFDIAAKSMGANVSFMPGELGVNEPLEDVGQYLQNWYDILIVRAKSHKDLLQLSSNVNIPVINARTDFNHPCEILGDLHYIKKTCGSFDNMKLVFVGEVTNICMSWFEAAVKFPIEVIQIAPEEYLADDALLRNLNQKATGKISISNDISAIDETGDIIYTDCWPQGNYDKISEMFLPYQITIDILSRTKENAIFLPCPPVTRGQEVSKSAMTSTKCKNFAAKEHLLYLQMSVLELYK